MRFVHETRRVTVAAPAGTEDVPMPLQDRSFRELTIWCEPVTYRVGGDGLPALGRDFTHETFFGPTSQDGSPQARTTDETFFAFDPGNNVWIWPANEPTSNLHRTGEQPKGFPITVQLTNDSLEASQPSDITGVTIYSVLGASTGTGSLSYLSGSFSLQWRAPGAGAPGAPVNVAAGGAFFLQGGDGSAIRVWVVSAELPAGDESDSPEITDADLVMDVHFTAQTIDQG